MTKSPSTVRSLASTLGLSPSTVAGALRGSQHFKPETIRRVRAAARAAGYRQNVLLSSMMSEIRRCQVRGFKGVLALLDVRDSERTPAAAHFLQRMVLGARERASELGFKLELFVIGDTEGMTVGRFNSILEARDIRGILLLPSLSVPDLSSLNWSRLSAVYTDYLIENPPLNSVCPDHFRGMIDTLRRMGKMGYARPGLFLSKQFEQRTDFHWSSAFWGFQQTRPGMGKVPILMTESFDRTEFKRWFKRYDPDVVIGHNPEAIDWMVECGADVPRSHGFVILNQIWSDRPCAGLDLQPNLLAARATEFLCGQVQRGETGCPTDRTIAGIPPRWVDGPTLLARSERG